MNIRFGYEIEYDTFAGVPMVVILSARPNAQQRLIQSDAMMIQPHLGCGEFFGRVWEFL